MRHPTAYLEHYADMSAANMLYKHGVSLDQYLADPARYEHLLGAPFPLMPAQTTVRVRLIREEILQERAEEITRELDDLPRKLAGLLSCGEQEAIPRLLATPNLEPLDTDDLRRLLQIRDMAFSRTAAAIATELQSPGVTYDRCIRTALCYAVMGRLGHVFSALRAAADLNDGYARHHHLYGLILALQGNADRARWEFGLALENEPFENGKTRIKHDRALV